jgi:hypothetical protein
MVYRKKEQEDQIDRYPDPDIPNDMYQEWQYNKNEDLIRRNMKK